MNEWKDGVWNINFTPSLLLFSFHHEFQIGRVFQVDCSRVREIDGKNCWNWMKTFL